MCCGRGSRPMDFVSAAWTKGELDSSKVNVHHQRDDQRQGGAPVRDEFVTIGYFVFGDGDTTRVITQSRGGHLLDR